MKVIVKSVFKDDDSIGDFGYDSGSSHKSMTVVIRWLIARHQDVEAVPGVNLLFLSKNKVIIGLYKAFCYHGERDVGSV